MSRCRCGMYVPETLSECLNCGRKPPGGPIRRRIVTSTGIKEVVVAPDNSYGVMPAPTSYRRQALPRA